MDPQSRPSWAVRLRRRLGREVQRRFLRSLAAGPVWCVDFVRIVDDILEFGGWVLAPGLDPACVAFRMNHHRVEDVRYPLPRTDIASLFWYLPDAGDTGFICRTAAHADSMFPKGFIALELIDSRTGMALSSESAFYYPGPVWDTSPPPPEAMRRVHGNELYSSFKLEGFSAFVKLERVLERRYGLRFASFSSILDWGCGCGRLARYLALLSGPRITGVDIDAENVAWCQRYIPKACFVVGPLRPPTGLRSSTFDLVIGNSVFTHLGESDQFDWLEELQRLLADDGLALLTIHGGAAIARSGFPAELTWIWRRKGFLATPNSDFAGVIAEPTYYCNSFHTQRYVRTRWSKYLHIVEIVPGIIGNNLDLVVARKVPARRTA